MIFRLPKIILFFMPLWFNNIIVQTWIFICIILFLNSRESCNWVAPINRSLLGKMQCLQPILKIINFRQIIFIHPYHNYSQLWILKLRYGQLLSWGTARWLVFRRSVLFCAGPTVKTVSSDGVTPTRQREIVAREKKSLPGGIGVLVIMIRIRPLVSSAARCRSTAHLFHI